jgi:general secretion pathway protein D
VRSIITAGATACLAILFLGGMSTDESTPASSAEVHDSGGIPIEQIIATVAHKTGKKYLVDPRVRAQVHIFGQEPSGITYGDLLTILEVNGFVAVESGGYVQVLPNANSRQTPNPLLTGSQTYPDAQFVTTVLTVKSLSAAQLVPILRPLLPQFAHLAAYPCSNALLIADTFANVKRMEAIIKALDVGPPRKENCDPTGAAPHTESPPPRRD